MYVCLQAPKATEQDAEGAKEEGGEEETQKVPHIRIYSEHLYNVCVILQVQATDAEKQDEPKVRYDFMYANICLYIKYVCIQTTGEESGVLTLTPEKVNNNLENV